MKRLLVIGVAALCMVGYCFTLYQAFYVAPLQDKLFFNQKIFYYHVPCAFVLFMAIIVCGIASILYLKRREGRWDDVAVAAGDVAVVFGAIVLITGSIWAKPAWEKWWVWDARLTSSLLLWMTMLAYTLIRKYGGVGSERLSSGLAIFAMVNVPMVYLSTKLWTTRHPTTSTVPGLQPEMKTAFWLSVLLFIVFSILLLRVRIDMVRSARKLHEARELGLDAGLFE